MTTLGRPAIRQATRTLRVLGTDITLIEPIRAHAEADLGFRLEFDVLDFQNCERKAATHAETYDVYDQCFHNLDIVWFWGALQPVDTQRIVDWDMVSPLTREGGINKFASPGFGDTPVSRLYVQPSDLLGPTPSRHVSMLPTVHNFDSFGFDRAAFGDATRGQASWSWLLSPDARGQIALVDEPAIGLLDAALAVEASGELCFADLGNLSVAEIDALMAVLEDRRRQGYFQCLWRTSEDAARLAREGRVTVQSMWSPAYGELGARTEDFIEAVPKEGYRAWHGGLSLSRHVQGAQLDMAYEYLNWWLSGCAGAIMARRGYYMSVPERVRQAVSPQEWTYWYEGGEAQVDLPGAFGQTVVRAGNRRPGGAYWNRARNIAVWNTTMDEHNYAARAWARFSQAVREGGACL
ncbi:MAG: signal peptide prediction [Pararhodobacter sp.]|nr:signal peptide prediction [Pararhodobacter sp.]